MDNTLTGGQRWSDQSSAVAATSAGTVLGSVVTINTKVATYTTLIASTAYDSDGLLIHVMCGAGGGAVWALVDIAIGAAASEQIIVANLFVPQSDAGVRSFYFPIPIAAGTRISARYQADVTGSAPLDVAVYPVAGDFGMNHVNRILTWGATTATSRGTNIDGGGTANIKGAYVTVVATTEADVSEILVAISRGPSATAAGVHFLVDIAIGAAASEQIIVPNLWYRMGGSTKAVLPEVVGPIPVHIPAGVRVSARCQSSTNTAADRTLDIAIYGSAT